MNIQFRKIHLPALPAGNAQALIKLAGNNNSGLTTLALPSGVSKSQIASRSNLDEIIQDIENDKIKSITILEWVHCLYNKDKWDAKNPDRSITTSEAIWKTAEQNPWLKQGLFWNLVLNYDGKEILASSLAMTYSSFCPQNQIDREKLEIVQILTISEPANKLVILCRQKLFTPYQLFQKYQFPAKASILEKTLENIVTEFSLIATFNHQQVKWLLQCLKEMKTTQQIKAVEQLLIKVDPRLGAEHPELINWLRQHYGSFITNSRWNELSSEAKAAMRKWLGAVSYQDFQKLVSLILNRVDLAKYESDRLRNRSEFWSNYSDRFERIRIFLPKSSVNILNNDLNNQDISVLLEDGSDPTEVCIFDFGNWFLVEFFRGNGSETRMFPKNTETEQLLFNSQLSIKKLRYLGLNNPIHDHEYIWQYFCEQWLRNKNILPNQGTEYFKGLPYRYSKYNWQTGLPKPSYENMRKRDRKLQNWREDIARLEREARIHVTNETEK
jgi:hypothetical protein